jgi:heme/copper-type cytochrome/quinol oxidase subunit 3
MSTPYPSDPVQAAANRRLGLYLFLISLSVLFGVSLVAYLIVRLSGTHTLPSGDIHLPTNLWISTVILLASGWSLHKAVALSCQNDLLGVCRSLFITSLLGLAFLGIQTPCMLELLADHYYGITQHIFGIYGLTFALILIHAVHVLGGIIPMFVLTWMAWRRSLSPSHFPTLDALAIYWRFLEIVWIILFGVFLITS